MNTLEIALTMGKRHNDVKRDVIKFNKNIVATKELLYNKSTKKNIEVYEIPIDQLYQLKYGEKLLSKVKVKKAMSDINTDLSDGGSLSEDIEELISEYTTYIDKLESSLEKATYEIEKRDKKISELESTIMRMDTKLDELSEDVKVLKTKNNFLIDQYEIARKTVKNAKMSMAIKQGGNIIENFERLMKLEFGNQSYNKIDMKSMKKIRGMLHPDKLNQDINKPFIFIDNIIKQNAQTNYM